MSNPGETQSFFLSTIKPMSDHITPYVTQVVGVIDPDTGEAIGTGLFCMARGRQAIVTAAHVLRKASEASKYTTITFTRGSGETPAIVTGQIVYADHYDVAVYLPDRDFPIGAEKAFWPEDRIDLELTQILKDYLFFQGFPRRFARFTRLAGNSLVSEWLAYGAMVSARKSDFSESQLRALETHLPDHRLLPEACLRAHQIAFEFSFTNGAFVALDESSETERPNFEADWSNLSRDGVSLPGQQSYGAFGLSGSPVWRIGSTDGPQHDWTPERSRLVGLVTDWKEGEGVLIATRASMILEVVAGL